MSTVFLPAERTRVLNDEYIRRTYVALTKVMYSDSEIVWMEDSRNFLGSARWSQRVPPCSSWAISQHSFWEPTIPIVASEAASQSVAQSSLSQLAVWASGARGGGKKRTANEGERMFSRGFFTHATMPAAVRRASMIALREL